jgi:hypothetical protein
MSFVERLRRDLTASAPKTAALGVLLAVGLYFWVPPLWRAVAGGDGATANAGAAQDVAASAIAAEPVATRETADAAEAQAGMLSWEEAERLRRTDELFRSAGRADVRGDAFEFDDEFLPLEVTFGEDAPDADRLVPRPKRKAQAPAAPPSPLKLASTLVSGERRAAVINSKVYTEGETVTAAGQTWTLKNVEPRRVLLEGASGPLELRINPFPTPRLGR